MNLLITYYSLVTQIKSVHRVLFFVLVRDVLGIEPCHLVTAPVLLHEVLIFYQPAFLPLQKMLLNSCYIKKKNKQSLWLFILKCNEENYGKRLELQLLDL